jgi:hypothetical protein
MGAEDTTTRVAELAKLAAQCFETAERDNGDTFYRLSDVPMPEWVKELVHAARGGDLLPDDYRYKWASGACEFIAEYDDLEDGAADFADQSVDVYTSARLAWLASNLQRAGYCDEAFQEYGNKYEGIISLIGLGQYAEAYEVYGLVLNFLQDAAMA